MDFVKNCKTVRDFDNFYAFTKEGEIIKFNNDFSDIVKRLKFEGFEIDKAKVRYKLVCILDFIVVVKCDKTGVPE